MSSIQLKYAIAALLKRMSTRPNVFTARSTSAWQSAALLRSQGCMETIVPPSARTASTVASASATPSPAPTISAPSRANSRAASRPMLPPVPVMMTTLPASFFDMSVFPPGSSPVLGAKCASEFADSSLALFQGFVGGVDGVVAQLQVMRMLGCGAEHEIGVFVRNEVDGLRALFEGHKLACLDGLGDEKPAGADG